LGRIGLLFEGFEYEMKDGNYKIFGVWSSKIESFGFLFLKTILFNMFLNVNLDQNNFKAQRP